MKTQIKLLVMALVTIGAGFISQSGWPETVLAWQFMGISVAGTWFVYAGKNFIAPSKSEPGTVNIWDIVSGLTLAVGTALSDFVAAQITSTVIVWTDVLKMVGVVVLGYFYKTYLAGKELAPK